jgi:hypothetical protein
MLISIPAIEGARWRTYATIAGVALAGAELWMTYNYKWEVNVSVRELRHVDFFYWRMRVYRQFAFAIVDGLLACVLWLSSTNRILVTPPTILQQIENTVQTLQSTYAQLTLLGNLRNAIVRDRDLRTAHAEYWVQEHETMAEIEREREVVDAKNIALSHIDVVKVGQAAELYVDRVFGGLRPPSQQTAKKND